MSEKPRKVLILGSTGSVGSNTIRVIQEAPEQFNVVGLACGRSVEKLCDQIDALGVRQVSVGSEEARDKLIECLNDRGLELDEVFVGEDGHQALVRSTRPDVVVASMASTAGLKATLQSINQNVQVLGIANKEVLVMAGSFICSAMESSSTALVPVDSEHSAIFQCLMAGSRSELSRIILTASGGPFRTLKKSELDSVTVAQALQHPNWSMGDKITIDSATLMNKGLEYIEAIQLFDVSREELEVLVHPQSIIHSMVEYIDGSVIAQLGLSDMRIPISLALTYPRRMKISLGGKLDFGKLKSLDFEAPDFEKFPCLKMAVDAAFGPPSGPIVLNAANEVAVQAFLKEEIGFTQIPQLIARAMDHFSGQAVDSLESVVELDQSVKAWSSASLNRGSAQVAN